MALTEVAIVFETATGSLDSVMLDVTFSEDPRDDNEPTQHPVEDGADVTDHIRLLPVQLTLEGLISETPLTQSQLSRAGIGESQYIEGYAAAQYARLLKLREERQLVSVHTARRVYENMVMTSLAAPVDPQTGKALRVQLSFQQIRIVRNKLVTIEVERARRTGAKLNLGQRVAKTVTTVVKDGILGNVAKVLTYDSGTRELGSAGHIGRGAFLRSMDIVGVPH